MAFRPGSSVLSAADPGLALSVVTTRHIEVNLLDDRWITMLAAWMDGSTDDRVCAMVTMAGILLHEMMHQYGLTETDLVPGVQCFQNAVISNTFVWAASQRYPQVQNTNCCNWRVFGCGGANSEIPQKPCGSSDNNEPWSSFGDDPSVLDRAIEVWESRVEDVVDFLVDAAEEHAETLDDVLDWLGTMFGSGGHGGPGGGGPGRFDCEECPELCHGGQPKRWVTEEELEACLERTLVKFRSDRAVSPRGGGLSIPSSMSSRMTE